MLGMELQDDEMMSFSSEPNYGGSIHHQVYTVIEETSEDLDSAGNPLVNLANLKRGSKYVAPRTDKATIAAREKVWLTAATWTTMRAAVNGMAVIPSDASRKVLMGYQYTLYLQGRHLEQVRQQLEE
jgi:hypothetical protein